jgi:hypothetical protein
MKDEPCDERKDEPCDERQALEWNVVDAVQQLYAAKGGDALPAATIAERKAVKALQEHIETHGCVSPESLSPGRAGTLE